MRAVRALGTETVASAYLYLHVAGNFWLYFCFAIHPVVLKAWLKLLFFIANR